MSFAYRISIGGNIVLVGIALGLVLRDPPAAAPPFATPTRSAAGARSEKPKGARDAAELRPSPGGPQLTPDAIAELQRQGISREAIVDGLINNHTQRYDKRVRALEKRYAPKPVPSRERLGLSWQSEAERTRELKEALGEEGYLAWDKDNTLRMLNVGGVRMNPQETEKAYRLQKEFDEKNRALQMAKDEGLVDEADRNTLYEQAQKKLDQELEKLLGTDRVAAMRDAPNPIADVSRRFEYLNPTPEQAREVISAEADIHAREAALVQRLKEMPASAANLTADLKAVTDAREESLRRVFGAEAYATMKQQNDSTYQKLTRYAEAWDLRDPQIQPVYETISAFHDQADRTRMAAEMRAAAGQPVSWREVNAGIDEARQQTEAGLANMIGGERVRRLKQNGLLDVR